MSFNRYSIEIVTGVQQKSDDFQRSMFSSDRLLLVEHESKFEIMIGFKTPRQLRYADVVKFGSVFCSLLKKLEKADQAVVDTSVQLAGQENLSSGVNSEV